jgi:hypothetical protein
MNHSRPRSHGQQTQRSTMKTTPHSLIALAIVAATAASTGTSTLRADDRNVPQTGGRSERYMPRNDWEGSQVRRTELDWAGSYSKYYGQRRHAFMDKERMIAKVDIDGDFNYDGVIDNADPADNGEFQQVPPGLVVGVGELTKVILRIRPYRVDHKGEAAVVLQLDGINRGDVSGKFQTFDEEVASTSQVRVWLEPSRKTLLLDSRDPAKRRVEWTMESTMAEGGAVTAANLPHQRFPRAVWVEGIRPHGQWLGDARLLLSVEQREVNDDAGYAKGSAAGYSKDEPDGKVVLYPTATSTKPLFARFRSAWDHILLSVVPQPFAKELVSGPSGADTWVKP